VEQATIPTLSFILPNFNHAKYLRQTLGAILNQSVRPLEVLVIDDASTDNSVEIIREIERRDPLVRLLCNERNMGVNESINRGIAAASGDFIYCGACDDQVLPGFVEKSMSLLQRFPAAKLCVVDLVQFDPETGDTRDVKPGWSAEPSFVTADAIAARMSKRRFYAWGGMAVMQKRAVLEIGGFRADLRWYADVFCVLALAFQYGACYLPESLVAARLLSTSYANAGRTSDVQYATVQAFLEALRAKPVQGATARIRISKALCVLGAYLMRPLLERQSNWDFISIGLLGRLLANVPVTILGVNPATPSPFRSIDRFVRGRLGLTGSIESYGIPLDSR
jgi:glycosyltransferase involved in cell wall biosynthesis